MGRLLQTTQVKLLSMLLIIGSTILCQSFQLPGNPYLINVDEKLQRFIGNSDDHSTIVLGGLEEGELYRVYVSPLLGNADVQLKSINKQLSFIGNSIILFEAQKENTFQFNFGDEKALTEFYFSVEPVEEEAIVANNKMAVISVNSNVTDQYLVEDVFIGGGCFDVTNITFNTDPGSRGTFANGQTNIGLEEGMILATGNISVAASANTQTGASAGSSGGSDPDLTQLAGTGINDAAVMEFDFEPTTDTVRFNYVFASEEYCDYTNSNFNDVFGFFLSGPGINGTFTNNAINIATLPNGQYVSINNVNHTVNQGFYVSNTTPATNTGGGCGGAHPLGTAPAINEVQYDAFTVILEAVAVVQPCQTYHIKLAIGDAVDSAWDSAVFLESNSFSAGTPVAGVGVNPSTNTNVGYESCDGFYFEFCREPGTDNSADALIEFTVSPSSTATAVDDYSPFPTSVTIPAGVDCVQLPITLVNDDIVEGQETIILELEDPCNCSDALVEFIIDEVPPLVSNIPDETVCGTADVTFTANPTGGLAPYTYNWSTGGTGSSETVTPNGSSVYVTITDDCNNQVIDTMDIISIPPPDATIAGSGAICPNSGTTVDITVTFTGTGPWTFTYTDGTTPVTITTTDNPHTITVSEPGTYTLSDVEESGCPGTTNGSAVITTSAVAIDENFTDLLCNGDNSGTITVLGTGGVNPYTYTWSDPNLSGNVLTGLGAGSYDLTVVDANGCDGTTTITLTEPPALQVSMGPPTEIDCNNPNGEATVSVSGGTPSYSYNWSNGNTGTTISTITPGTYTVVVTDANGCSDTDDVTITEDTTPPTAVASFTGIITCDVQTITISGAGSSTGSDFTYLWTTSDGTIDSGDTTLDPVVSSGGTYTLTVTNNANGCEEMFSVTIPEDTTPPNADAGPDMELTCTTTEVVLLGVGSDIGPDYTYDWTTSDGNIVSGGTTLTPIVDQPGTYTITVVDITNGCEATDQVVVTQDAAIPSADAGPPMDITCIIQSVQLDGTGSSGGSDFFFQWTTSNGNIVSGANTLTPIVDAGGTYFLEITSLANGCVSNSSVIVNEYLNQPIADIATPPNLSCNATEVQLDGSGSSQGTNIEYDWTTSGGNIVSGDDTDSPIVDGEGTYTLTVTDNESGCEDEITVTVVDVSVFPSGSGFATDIFDCVTSEVMIDATASDSGPNYNYNWATNNGTIISGGTTLTPMVGESGIYTLTITNTVNNCATDVDVEVFDFIQYPNITQVDPGAINCVNEEVEIISTVSNASSFTFVWSTPDGNIVEGANTLSPLVDQAGDYTLLVINTANFCESEETITIIEDYNYPTADAGPPGELTCYDPQLTLDGTASSNGNNFFYSWSLSDGNIVSGGNTLEPVIDEAGTYTLVVTNISSQCKDTSSVDISVDQVNPLADAGTDALLGCWSPTIELDGSASSSGMDFVYDWSTVDGNIVNGQNSDEVEIDAGGTYILLVTDTTNGCTALDEVLVTEDFVLPIVGTDPGGEINCIDLTIPLVGTASGNTTNFVYEWQFFGTGSISSGQGTLNAEAIQPDMYYLVVLDTINGCTATDSVLVTKDDNVPVIQMFATDTLDCVTQSFVIDATGSTQNDNILFEWSTVDGQFESGDTTLAPTINSSGTYELVLTDTSNNCVTTSLLTIEPDTVHPDIILLTTGIINCYNGIIPIEAELANEGTTYTFDWTASNGGTIVLDTSGLIIDVSTEGSYQFDIVNDINGCISQASIDVVEDLDIPVLTIGEPDTLTCSLTSVGLSATVDTHGDDYTFEWTTDTNGSLDNDVFTLNPIVSGASTYVLSVQNDINGCEETISVEVAEDVLYPTAVGSVDDFLSCQTLDVELDGVGSSSGGNFSYNWTTSNGNILSGNTSLNPVVDEPGDYVLVVLDENNNCTDTVLVNVTQDLNAPILAIASPDTLTCGVLSVDLIGDAGMNPPATYNYQWTTIDGSIITSADVPNVTADQPGTYAFEVFDSYNGCFTTIDIDVVQDVVLPIADAGSAVTLNCIVLDQLLDGSGSSQGGLFEYNWTTVDGQIVDFGNTLNPQVNEPGIYELLVTNIFNECENTATVVVPQDIELPLAEAGDADVLDCYDAELNLSGQGSSTGSIYTYQWISLDGNMVQNSTTLNPTIDVEGQYELIVTNTDNGCVQSDLVSIARDTTAPILVGLDSDTLTCGVLETELAVNSSVTNNVQYDWSTLNGNITSSASASNPMVDAPGLYSLIFTDLSNGCQAEESIEVYQNIVVPLANAGSGGLITCEFLTIDIIGSASTNSGSTDIQWTTQTGDIVSGGTTVNPTIGSAGTYTICVIDMINECMSLDSVFVPSDQEYPFISSVQSDILDCDTEEVLVDASSTAMETQYVLEWNTNNGNFISGTDGLSPMVDLAGQYVLTITDTINGCVTIDTLDVYSDYEYPVVSAGDDFVLPCYEEYTNLNGAVQSSTSNLEFTWTTPDGNIVQGANTLDAAVDAEGLYTLTILNLTNGCSDTDQVLVTEDLPENLLVETLDPPCADQFGSLNITNIEGGTPPYVFSLNNGDTYSSTMQYDFLNPGEYQVIAQDAFGCETEITLASIVEPPALDILVDATVEVLEGDQAQIIANVNYNPAFIESISWFPPEGLSCADCLDPIVTVLESSVFELTVANTQGCEVRTFVNVLVDKTPKIYIPNAFSPDSDGENEVFMIFADTRNIEQIKTFEVFDRWGEKVFEQYNFQPNDPAHGWDGTIRGKLLNSAVFVYYAEVEMIDGRIEFYEGDVFLRR